MTRKLGFSLPGPDWGPSKELHLYPETQYKTAKRSASAWLPANVMLCIEHDMLGRGDPGERRLALAESYLLHLNFLGFWTISGQVVRWTVRWLGGNRGRNDDLELCDMRFVACRSTLWGERNRRWCVALAVIGLKGRFGWCRSTPPPNPMREGRGLEG